MTEEPITVQRYDGTTGYIPPQPGRAASRTQKPRKPYFWRSRHFPIIAAMVGCTLLLIFAIWARDEMIESKRFQREMNRITSEAEAQLREAQLREIFSRDYP